MWFAMSDDNPIHQVVREVLGDELRWAWPTTLLPQPDDAPPKRLPSGDERLDQLAAAIVTALGEEFRISNTAQMDSCPPGTRLVWMGGRQPCAILRRRTDGHWVDPTLPDVPLHQAIFEQWFYVGWTAIAIRPAEADR